MHGNTAEIHLVRATSSLSATPLEPRGTLGTFRSASSCSTGHPLVLRLACRQNLSHTIFPCPCYGTAP